MIRDDDAKDLADIRAAYDLLEGIGDTDEKGLPVAAYLEEETTREIEARKALARLLRNGRPLDSLVRHLLAGLFDPTPYEYVTKSGLPDVAQSHKADRQLYFKNPSRRTRQNNRHLKIAFEVGLIANNDEKVDSAISDVAKRYGISKDIVWKAWMKFRDSPWIAK
jgi:hypothetical protein